MPHGFSIKAPGVQKARDQVIRLARLTEDAASKALAEAGVDAGHELKTLLNQPKHVDPFWGVTGAQGPVGLARRSGLTSAGVIAPGRV